MAAYSQYNPYITNLENCCKTGRLRSGYGVEAMLRLLSKNPYYNETHNGFLDAVDEFQIMKILGFPFDYYKHTRIN